MWIYNYITTVPCFYCNDPTSVSRIDRSFHQNDYHFRGGDSINCIYYTIFSKVRCPSFCQSPSPYQDSHTQIICGIPGSNIKWSDRKSELTCISKKLSTNQFNYFNTPSSNLLSYDLCSPEKIVSKAGMIFDAQSCNPFGLSELFIPRIEQSPRTNIFRSCKL